MTVQQQVAERVMNLSDEGAALVGQLISGLNPQLFRGTETARIDVSRRFGAGKNVIGNTDDHAESSPFTPMSEQQILSFLEKSRGQTERGELVDAPSAMREIGTQHGFI